jgi:hypothetical protein
MANLSKTTKDHDEIRRWAEERGGKPSHVKSTSSEDEVGILRIDFPGFSGEGSLEEISWDDFFEKFDAQGLALVYQEETADGERSNFNKLVSGDSVETDDEKPAARKTAGRKSSSRKVVPVKKGSAKKSATTKSSAAKPAAKKAPAKKVPAKKVPAKKAPAKKVPAKKVPAKKVPAKKAAAKKAPAKGRP